MASNTYIQYYVDKPPKKLRRPKKQGRHKTPLEIKRSETISIHTTKKGKSIFLEEKRKTTMSQSAFGDMILFLGLEKYKQLFDSDNCFTQ